MTSFSNYTLLLFLLQHVQHLGKKRQSSDHPEFLPQCQCNNLRSCSHTEVQPPLRYSSSQDFVHVFWGPHKQSDFFRPDLRAWMIQMLIIVAALIVDVFSCAACEFGPQLRLLDRLVSIYVRTTLTG